MKIALVSATAFAAPVFAADEAADGHAAAAEMSPVAFQIVTFVSALLVFGVAFFVLSKKVWPVITKALDEREEKIKTEIQDAERSRKQAQSALQEYESALAEARVEAGKILEQAKSDQLKIAAELKAGSERELAQLREAAKRDIEAAKRTAVSEIYSQMATTASDIAGKILQREISPDDQQKLVEESLEQLSTVRSN